MPSADSPSVSPAPPAESPSTPPAAPAESSSSSSTPSSPSALAPVPSPVLQPTQTVASVPSSNPGPKPSPEISGSGGGSNGPGFGSAVAYTPYNADQSCKSTSQVAADFQKISGFDVVRLYGTDCNQIGNVIAATHSNVKLYLGIFDINSIQSEVQIMSSVWPSPVLLHRCRTHFLLLKSSYNLTRVWTELY